MPPQSKVLMGSTSWTRVFSVRSIAHIRRQSEYDLVVSATFSGGRVTKKPENPTILKVLCVRWNQCTGSGTSLELGGKRFILPKYGESEKLGRLCAGFRNDIVTRAKHDAISA